MSCSNCTTCCVSCCNCHADGYAEGHAALAKLVRAFFVAHSHLGGAASQAENELREAVDLKPRYSDGGW